MKKKYVLKNKRRFCSIIVLLSVILTTVFLVTNAYGFEGTDYQIVTVQRGDTLWGIAGEYCKKGDIRKYIYEIKKANGLTESNIYEGDELRIPV